jgi:putative membrane protein
MKKIFRYTLLITFALITTNHIWGNLSFQNIPSTIIKTALILALFEVILKPIIKIITIPINILTLGFFRIIINTLGLYLAVFLFEAFKVGNINSPATKILGFPIPQLQFQNFWAYLVTSFTISLIIYFFNLILRKKSKKI